jgi:hypothetical protein
MGEAVAGNERRFVFDSVDYAEFVSFDCDFDFHGLI